MYQRYLDSWNVDNSGNNYDLDVVEGELTQGISPDQFPSNYSLLSLSEVLHAFGAFPPYSLLFGVCDDGLPLILNLKDSSAGSLLVTGDPRRGKTQVLKTALASAAMLNRVDMVNFCIISPFPDEMADLYKFPHCQGLAAPYERRASEIILELSAIAEQKRYGRERGPAFILAIDDLSALVGDHLDYEVLLHLRWLISKGPGSEIWTIATLPSHSATTCDPGISNIFGTKIFTSQSLGNYTKEIYSDLNSSLSIREGGLTFTTRINRRPVQFIPLAIK